MDMQALIEEVRLELTGDVVSLELTDASLMKLANKALREIQRYIDTTKLITIPYNKCIDLSGYSVSSVARVYRAKGYAAGTTETGATMDPMYASQWQILHGVGNINNFSDYAYNFGSWNTLLQIRNTTSTDLAFIYDKSASKLYINISTGIPDKITIEYVPRFNDVSEIISDFWNDVLVRMTTCLTKIAVGRVRSKFKQSNALWSLDGDTILEEGKAELAALREELKASTQLCYPVD